MQRVLVNKLFGIIICLLIFSLEGSHALACSLWAAAGDQIKDGGTLVGMTWDVPQGIKGELRLVIPKKGSRYLGLFPLQTKDRNTIVAGINELGLVIITASPNSKSSKKRFVGNSNLVETILRSFGTVDAVMANKTLFLKTRPMFLIIADRSKIILVQIGSAGKHTVDVAANGLFYQTNHYTHQSLLKENELFVENSMLRLNRLQNLLANHQGPFVIDAFLSIADDRANGPDNSIWRIGSSEKKERTLAGWVTYLSQSSPPELYFKLSNPGANELNYEIKLDKIFWTEGTE